MDGRIAPGGGNAAAEAIDDPHGIDAGFWREEFVNGTLPLGLQVVTFRSRAIDALIGGFPRRHRGIFGELAILFEEGGDFVFDFFFAFVVFVYFDNDIKVRAPFDAQSLIERVTPSSSRSGSKPPSKRGKSS